MAEPTEGSASLLSDRYKLKSIIELIIQNLIITKSCCRPIANIRHPLGKLYTKRPGRILYTASVH